MIIPSRIAVKILNNLSGTSVFSHVFLNSLTPVFKSSHEAGVHECRKQLGGLYSVVPPNFFIDFSVTGILFILSSPV